MGDFTGEKARKQAKKSAKLQREEIQRQKNIEVQKIAEEEDVIARRMLRGKKGGRSLLKTSAQENMNSNLGGING